MENFDIKSAKYVSIIIGICLVFVLVIANAYKYLPENETQKFPQVTESNIPAEEDVETDAEEESVEEDEAEDVEIQTPTESVSAQQEVSETVSETVEESVVSETDSFEKAKQLKKEELYLKAIDEFNKIADNTTDSVLKSDCYEEISLCYGLLKRYGTALSYAQKSYNMNPTSSKEVLLARLYYKTGDIERANKRINNVLQRDFILEK